MSKRKVNLIYTKRGRDAHLRLTLYNLNLSEDLEKFDVAVYIGEDDESKTNQLDYSAYDKLRIEHLHIPNLKEVGGVFCKGHVLNQVLLHMRSDYDWLSIMDVDMVYRKDFFIRVDKELNGYNNRAVHSLGYHAGSKDNYLEILQSNYDYDYLRQNFGGKLYIGPSQLSLTKDFNERICKLLGIRTICDTAGLGYDFVGWGREDDWTFELAKYYPGMRVTCFTGMWCHIWHEPQVYSEAALARNVQTRYALKAIYLSRLYGRFMPWRKFWRGVAFRLTRRVYDL